MDLQYSPDRIILDQKVLTNLDRFVLDFIRILETQTPYVIVSGYVAILFGRSRGTEDVDILIPPLEIPAFRTLHAALVEGGFEFLNAEDADGLHDMLTKGVGIRAARKDRFIPNMELKFFKDDMDHEVFRKRVRAEFSGGACFISPPDIQIAYKLFLGSDKDIDDALFLWEIFRDNLDRNRMRELFGRFRVNGDACGIIL
jgi:hypothetical protein